MVAYAGSPRVVLPAEYQRTDLAALAHEGLQGDMFGSNFTGETIRFCLSAAGNVETCGIGLRTGDVLRVVPNYPIAGTDEMCIRFCKSRMNFHVVS
jgi:hypothetical protein